MTSLNNLKWELFDCFYPVIQQPSSDAKEKDKQRRASEQFLIKERVKALPSDEKQLREHLDACNKALEQERAQRQSTEARLTSIVGLTSIAGTVVFSGLLAQAAGTLSPHTQFAKWFFSLASLYLVLQLFCSIIAAFKGLSRMNYSDVSPSDLLPTDGTIISVFLRERIIQVLEMQEEHRSNNDKKISCMAVAHRAMKNFLFGLLLFATAAAFLSIQRAGSTSDIDDGRFHLKNLRPTQNSSFGRNKIISTE